MRLIAGDIQDNGIIRRQTGNFTVEKQGTGHYKITFSPPFSSITSVVGTQVSLNNESTLDNLVITNFGNESCELRTGDPNGNFVDRFFAFIAVGE